MTRSAEPFFDVPRVSRPTSEGTVELPILYYDTSMILAAFPARLDAVTAEVTAHGLRPAITVGGRAVVLLAGYDYRATTIGPYREVGLAVPVVRKDAAPGPRWQQILRDVDSPRRDLGFYVLHLPVTTSAANAAGREIWGLPKFTTTIDVGFRGRDVRIRVEVPDGQPGGQPILSLDGRAGIGVPAPSLGLLLYSWVGHAMLRTTVNVRGSGTAHLPGSVRLHAGAVDHPMADALHRLGLAGTRPLALLTTHRFQSRLNLGAVTSDPATSPSTAPATR